MKKLNRTLSFLLALVMVFTMVPAAGLAVVTGEDATHSGTDHPAVDSAVKDTVSNGQFSAAEIENPGFDLKNPDTSKVEQIAPYEPAETVRVIVVLEQESLLERGFTTDQIRSSIPAVEEAVNSMTLRQNAMLKQIQNVVRSSGLAPNFSGIAGLQNKLEAKYSYTVAMNGLAVEVPYGTLDAIRDLAGVKTAYVATHYELPEDITNGASAPDMTFTHSTFGAAKAWETLGYTGQGMTIAIVDTGLDWDHPSFAAAPEGASLTEADIELVLDRLNAYSRFTETSSMSLTTDKVYYSEKVPFGFNYVDSSLDITHDYDMQGDHGTHVAGISAANKLDSTTVVGVAPDAQIVVMKVFGQNGGAYDDDIMAAIQDCILLGVDAINMSLGSPAGFTDDHNQMNAVFATLLETDIILAVSAGNSSSASYGNYLGTDLDYASNPDNGIVGSPASYTATTTVGSVENTHIMMPYFLVGDAKIAYNDATEINRFWRLLGDYEYVMVPGFGAPSDYEGIDVTGRVAVVSRGTLDFTAKQQHAYDAGAVALVVYDNAEGTFLNMYDQGVLPNVFITKESGAVMAQAAGDDGIGSMTILRETEQTPVESPSAGLMSDFSSWGVTPDLQLVPDVSAPGGYIYSCYNDGQYGTMSGTSMASPHIAGMAALVLQYLRDKHPNMSVAEMRSVSEALIMSTAAPLVDENGILYSPRKQGSGSANVYSALVTSAYLTALQSNGEQTPKAALGDDPDKTGVYSFSFTINNFGTTNQVYALDGSMLTEYCLDYEGRKYLSQTGYELSADVIFGVPASELDYDADGNGSTDMQDVQFLLDVCTGLKTANGLLPKFDLIADDELNTADAQALYEMLLNTAASGLVTVPAGESLAVTVTVTLSDEDKAYMDANFVNGIYVDGFVRCYAQSEGGVDLSLPFMGFYGDWHDAPMFDSGWYYDDSEYSRYPHVIFVTRGADPNSSAGLGLNPYILDEYDPEHNVLSPNGDTYYDYVNEIYISLMRSAELLEYVWTDDATGEELFYEWYSYVRKTYYWAAYDLCVPSQYSAACLPFTMLDEKGALTVEDLQHLTLTIRGYLDDGDLDSVVADEYGTPITDPSCADAVVEIPVVIDLKAPKMDISSIRYFTDEDGRCYVSFDVSDNYDIAAVVSMTTGGYAYEYLHVNTKAAGVDGESDTIVLDITDYDATFDVALCDYGCNETYYQMVNPYASGLDSDKFYAFRRFSTVISDSAYYMTDALNGWYSFETADNMTMHTQQAASGEPTVFAAEYIDGYVIGAQAGTYDWNTLFTMKAGSWDRIDLGSARAMNKTVYEWPGKDGSYFPLKMIALDMAYDYTTDTLYMLANALEDETYFPEGVENILLKVDYTNGDVTILGIIESTGDETFNALTLACDNSGVLYTINYQNGKLYTINKTPVSTTEKYGYGTYEATCVTADNARYYPAAYTQSMTVDHETDTLYWAGYQGHTGTAYFIEMDKTNGSIVSFQPIENNGEMCGLFIPYDGDDLIPEGELEYIEMSEQEIYMVVGQNTTLSVLPNPINASVDVNELVWTSYDESVATVSPYGIVEATGIGATTITAEYKGFVAECTVNVSDVSGTLYAWSDNGSWLMMDASDPASAMQLVDVFEVDDPDFQKVTAAAFFDGYIYAAVTEEGFDEDWNAVYTTLLYKLDAATLLGEKIGEYEGKTTALAFNYADGFMYGLTCSDVFEEYYDEMWDEFGYAQTITYSLIRVNLSTAETVVVDDLNDFFAYSDSTWQYNTCSGALAIDYEGNFYVNGDEYDNYFDNILVRFTLDENDQIDADNAYVFAGYGAYGYAGDTMLWSESNNGILRIAGTTMTWTDVSDMENVTEVSLGTVRTSGYNVYALVQPLTGEPELPQVAPTDIVLEQNYTVAVGETVKVIPTLTPWNATGTFLFTIGDTSVATVDENGVITGLKEEGQTTVTVTVAGTDISATASVTVKPNPGYLFGYAQADIAQGVPLESWIKMPISDPSKSVYTSDIFDFTVYAADYYDSYVYAFAQSNYDGLYYFLSIDPSSHTYKVLNQSSVLIRDMAFDYTTGTMYAIGNTELVKGGLYQLNLTTGELTFVGDNYDGYTLITLACDDEGMLYTSDEYGEVFMLDKDWVELTPIGIYGPESQYLQAMTYDFNNDAIYWVCGGHLYRLDLENEELVDLGLADMDSGEMGTAGCIISGLYSIPKPENTPVIPETVTPSGVVMDAKNTVAVGDTITLNAVVLPVSVSTVDQTLTWSSDDETIATVDENGVVTGVSAGSVWIWAQNADGWSGYTEVTVTEERRHIYGYDEISRSWMSFDFDGSVVATWADAEGLSPIVAAQYVNEVLYAYDADGYYYSIDTETFERTLLGDGIHGLTTSLEAWDRTGAYYVDNVPYKMIDLTYARIPRGWFGYTYVAYGVMMAHNVSDWQDSFSYKVAMLDMETGEIAEIIAEDVLVDYEMSLRPSNLLWLNDMLYTVNGYITGMVTTIDPLFGDVSGVSIFAEYWGDFNGSRSMIEDPLTGKIYALRDKRTQYIGEPGYDDSVAEAVLCEISLKVARCDKVCMLTNGSNTNLRITGMFIK